MTRLREIMKIYAACQELGRVARRLQRINELYCTADLSKKQIDEEIALEAKAKALAEELGLCAVHQHDPRSGSIFLVEKDINVTNKTELANAAKLYLEY